jgi:hypothetical protein
MVADLIDSLFYFDVLFITLQQSLEIISLCLHNHINNSANSYLEYQFMSQ